MTTATANGDPIPQNNSDGKETQSTWGRQEVVATRNQPNEIGPNFGNSGLLGPQRAPLALSLSPYVGGGARYGRACPAYMCDLNAYRIGGSR